MSNTVAHPMYFNVGHPHAFYLACHSHLRPIVSGYLQVQEDGTAPKDTSIHSGEHKPPGQSVPCLFFPRYLHGRPSRRGRQQILKEATAYPGIAAETKQRLHPNAAPYFVSLLIYFLINLVCPLVFLGSPWSGCQPWPPQCSSTTDE